MLDRRVHLAATLLGLLSLSFATHAVAQGRQQRQDHGWYVVGAIANSTISVCDIFGCLYPDSNSPDTGLAVSVGWRLGRHAGIEVEYLDAGTPAWGDSGLRYRVDTSGLRGVFVWNFTFRGRWSAYVQGGLTHFDARSRVSGFGPYPTITSHNTRPTIGGGGELKITGPWSLRLGLESSELDDRLLDQRQGALGTILIGARRSF